jgi:riboflavin biosynthesis pyrimidine reductase
VGVHDLGSDLPSWRKSQGLAPQPAIVVASASLDFPIPESIQAAGQRLMIATGQEADPDRVRDWEARGYEVIRAGAGREVNGGVLCRCLSERGFNSLYLIAGPLMLETMVREEQLSVLFQTISLQLLGGEAFRSMVPGPILGVQGQTRMSSLYYDEDAGGGVGQWFAQFAFGEKRWNEGEV